MGEGWTPIGNSSTSVGRRRAGARYGSKFEMGGGIPGIARPDLFPVLIERDPFAVACAVGARKHFVMAVRTVQRNGRMGCGPVAALR